MNRHISFVYFLLRSHIRRLFHQCAKTLRRAAFFNVFIGFNAMVVLIGLFFYIQSEHQQTKRRGENDETHFTLNINSYKEISGNISHEIKPEVVKILDSRPEVKECKCPDLINANWDEIERAKRVNKSMQLSTDYFIQETEDCKNFLRKRGYITDSLTENERDFPLAYSIVMYTSVEQSERLLRAIYRPQNIYCIHVDIKVKRQIYKAMESISNCFDNVFMASKRINVRWGTMTLLEPDLHCMAQLWNSSVKWKYFINLTGQEFPLKTNFELVEILKAFNGASDVAGTRKRANTVRWEKAGDPPYGIIPTKGNMHVMASRAFVEFMLFDKRAKDFLDWCQNVSIPDEVYFSSLHHNPHLGIPGSYKGTPESFSAENTTEHPYLARYINWEDHNIPCYGKFVRSVCIFGVGDLPNLAKRRELFVNKLYIHLEPLAFDCLEELIFNRTRDEYVGQRVFDANWYKNLGFVKNAV